MSIAMNESAMSVHLVSAFGKSVEQPIRELTEILDMARSREMGGEGNFIEREVVHYVGNMLAIAHACIRLDMAEALIARAEIFSVEVEKLEPLIDPSINSAPAIRRLRDQAAAHIS